MAMGPSSHPVYEFGPFHLESGQHLLLRDGQPVAIPPKAFEILAALLDRRGALVPKEDLQNLVWPDTFVDENNLTQQISLLRRILGDSPEKPQYVETVPRFGYRFIAQVQEMDEEGMQEGALAAAKEDSPATHSTRRRAFFWSWGGAVAIGLALLLAGFYIAGRRDSRLNAANPQRIRSLVVLPLTNLTGDSSQDYFADAMTDSLTTDLAQIRELRVISGTSAMHYKGTHETLPEIARELNVDGVVEGSVSRSGDQVRITAQLVDAPTDRHLWAHSYEREIRDVITLQDEVARNIVDEIQVKLTPDERVRLAKSRVVDPEAYQLYLRGRYLAQRATEPDLRKAVETLQASISKDPNYAPTHAALVTTYDTLMVNGYDQPTADAAKIKAEIDKTLELDDTLSEGHVNLADYKVLFERDWATHKRELDRAMELSPNSYDVHIERGSYFEVIGHFDDAIAEMKRLQELDPLGFQSQLELGQVYMYAGRYDESITQFKKCLELDRNYVPARAELAFVYMLKGERDAAAAEYGKTRSLMASEKALVLDQWMAPVEIFIGNRREAEKNAEWWSQEANRQHIDAYYMGALYAELGDAYHAFLWFEKALQERSASIIYIKLSKEFPEAIRSDQRYKDLLRRINLPD